MGPASAGSDPGPVCYELGGERPTVTDANLILGYLNKDYFLGGEMKVNEEKARAAMRRHIGEPLGLDEVEAAAGVFRIINQSMADATKVVSVQRGPRPARVRPGQRRAGPARCTPARSPRRWAAAR